MIVDDNSPDGTGELADAAHARAAVHDLTRGLKVWRASALRSVGLESVRALGAAWGIMALAARRAFQGLSRGLSSHRR